MPIFESMDGQQQEEFDDPYQTEVDDVIDEYEENEETAALSEVEIRLEEANYLKALLKHSFFDSNSEIAKRVEKRVRNFIQAELKVLLGLSETVPAPSSRTYITEKSFSSDQERVLKALADRVLTKEKQEGSVNVVPAKAEAPKPLPVIAAQAPTQPKGKPGRKKNNAKIVEREVNLPDGTTKKVKINVTGQTKPAEGTKGGYPALSAQDAARVAETQALTGPSQNSVVSLALSALGNIPVIASDD